MSKKLIAAALAVSLVASAVTPASASAKLVAPVVPYNSAASGATWIPFTVMGCASGIILSAMVASSRDKRQLTAPEAWTCGILFWFAQPRANARGR